jgi:tight adherence protein B
MQTFMVAAGTILFFVLVTLAFAGPSSGKATTRRLSAIKMRHSDSADVRVEQQMRKVVAARRPIIFTDGQQINYADKLRLRLAQTGKKWTLQQYMYASGGLAFVIMAILLLNGASFFLGLFSGLLIGAGLPHMVVNFLVGRRIKNFTTNFPDAIELLVRGLKSGMPVSETLSVIAKEIAGSVGEEFKLVVENIKIGTPEFQFFVITLAIQRETGGNLAETLANLADVLRKRAQMKLKIRAMSSESKASAYIVGSLPFFVFGMIWTINQEYLEGFFHEPRLMIAGVVGAVWMAIGVFIMAKMVNFEI